MRIAAALFSLCLLGTLGASEQDDFSLPDLDGVEHRLSDVRGKWLVMNFWATWCPPCIDEMPELESFHQKHKDSTALVWGITYEDTPVAEVKAFIEKLSVSYPILGHGAQPVVPFGKVKVLPTTFVIDPEGKFHTRLEGRITAAELEQIISQ